MTPDHKVGADLRAAHGLTQWLGTALLILAGLFVYWPALTGSWLWDDDAEILLNSRLRDFAGLLKIWFAPAGPDYFPLKDTLQWMQWQAWNTHVLGYHLTNLALHVAGAFLLWRLLERLGLRWAYLAGLLWVVHPVNVESVAWISELKNVLSLLLVLLAMGAWLDFVADPVAAPVRAWGSYGRSLLWFLLAMLAKSSVVMFPLGLALYAGWRGEKPRWRALLPFFGIAAVLGLVTYQLQIGLGVPGYELRRPTPGFDVPLGGFFDRLAQGGAVLTFYLAKFVFPVRLLVLYPRWTLATSWPLRWLPWLAVTGVSAWLWTKRSGVERGDLTALGGVAGRTSAVGSPRSTLFALGWYGLNLLPVLGVAPMAYLHLSAVADHFAYLAMLGLTALAAGALGCPPAGYPPTGWPPTSGRRTLVAIALCAALAGWSRHYAATFHDEASLWTHTLRRNPGSWVAHNNLGLALEEAGKRPEALAEYAEAVRLRPDYAWARDNLGTALAAAGRNREAIAQYEIALRLLPDFAKAHQDLGAALAKEGREAEAIAEYRRAVRLDGSVAAFHNNLGLALFRTRNMAAAIAEFKEVVRLQPELAEGHNNLAGALAMAGRWDEAIAEGRTAVRIDPGYREAHNNLGDALCLAGRFAEAIAEYEAALRIDPHYVDARKNLAIARKALAHHGSP